MLHTKYQGTRPYGFRQQDFFYAFPYISLCKTCDSQGQGNFCPEGGNLNKLGRGPLGDATYQSSRPYGFRLEDFFMFSLYKFM